MPENESAGRAGVLFHGTRQVVLVAGVCSLMLGVVIAGWPHKSVAIAELLFGLYLVLSGALQLIIAVGSRFAMPLRVLVFVSGALSVCLAVLCFRSGNSVLLLALWIGIAWAIRGVIQATVAVWHDGLPEGGKQELFGLFTMVIGIVVIVVPFDSLDVLALAAGGLLVVLGALEILTGARGRGDVVSLPAAARVPLAPN
ncbi:HdeD family acid-resistance protein [Nocardia sp. GCM10030253]|uniref:HdeD family acid-resistance protein n=1 Tax=Nocardia sp. GCM10030253 TaxID=3273404 RepID=UPI003632F074